jgi:hypothetical protein
MLRKFAEEVALNEREIRELMVGKKPRGSRRDLSSRAIRRLKDIYEPLYKSIAIDSELDHELIEYLDGGELAAIDSELNRERVEFPDSDDPDEMSATEKTTRVRAILSTIAKDLSGVMPDELRDKVIRNILVGSILDRNNGAYNRKRVGDDEYDRIYGFGGNSGDHPNSTISFLRRAVNINTIFFNNLSFQDYRTFVLVLTFIAILPRDYKHFSERSKRAMLLGATAIAYADKQHSPEQDLLLQLFCRYFNVESGLIEEFREISTKFSELYAETLELLSE